MAAAFSAALIASTAVPAGAQVQTRLGAEPQEKKATPGEVTLKRGLLAKPENSKAEAEDLLRQLRVASAELKALASRSMRPRERQRGDAHRRALGTVLRVARNLDAEAAKWEQKLSSVGDDAQLLNIDLQNALQKQHQTLQTISNVSKMLHDTAMAIIRKIG